MMNLVSRVSVALACCLLIEIVPTYAEEASSKPEISAETGRFYLPNDGKHGTQVVKDGDEVLRQPIRWDMAARTATEVRFATSDGDAVIPAGTILPAVRILHVAGMDATSIAWCTHVPYIKDKARGLLGMLSTTAMRSLKDGRKCVVDRNGDGTAELALLIDDGTTTDRSLRPISPVALNMMSMAEIGSGDYVSIVVRKASRPSFRIVMYQNGKQVHFDTISVRGMNEPYIKSVDKKANYPLPFGIYGARFEIRSFDPITGTVTISWPSDGLGEKVPVPDERRYVDR